MASRVWSCVGDDGDTQESTSGPLLARVNFAALREVKESGNSESFFIHQSRKTALFMMTFTSFVENGLSPTSVS